MPRKVLEIRETVLVPQKTSYENFPWILGFRICSMAKNENPEMPEIHRKLSKLENTHC